jgi:hypothetical protein
VVFGLEDRRLLSGTWDVTTFYGTPVSLDFSPDFGPVMGTTAAQHGDVQVETPNGPGTDPLAVYVPARGFLGQDSFQATVLSSGRATQWTVNVTVLPSVGFQADQSGANFGQPVPEAVRASADPSQYVLATHDGTVGNQVETSDTQLAPFEILGFSGASQQGQYQFTFSDPSKVALFDTSGNLVYRQGVTPDSALTMNLVNDPGGIDYEDPSQTIDLSGREGATTFYLAGLGAATDLDVTVSYIDQGQVISSYDIHMTIAAPPPPAPPPTPVSPPPAIIVTPGPGGSIVIDGGQTPPAPATPPVDPTPTPVPPAAPIGSVLAPPGTVASGPSVTSTHKGKRHPVKKARQPVLAGHGLNKTPHLGQANQAHDAQVAGHPVRVSQHTPRVKIQLARVHGHKTAAG